MFCFFFFFTFVLFSWQGIQSFIQTANGLGICVAVSEKVSRHSRPEDFDRIIDNLWHKPQARVVVMFVDEDNVRWAIFIFFHSSYWGQFTYTGISSTITSFELHTTRYPGSILETNALGCTLILELVVNLYSLMIIMAIRWRCFHPCICWTYGLSWTRLFHCGFKFITPNERV